MSESRTEMCRRTTQCQWKPGSTPSSSSLKLLLLLLTLLTLVTVLGAESSATAASSSNNVSAMYLMGDSSVDCGFNTLFYPLLHRNLSVFPCNGDDDSLLPHFLAEKIGLPHSQPLYSQNGTIEAMISGINFGSAQATIMSSQSYESLNHQLRQVLDTIQLMRLRLGQDLARQFVNSSIFYLSFGQIDLINLTLHNGNGTMLKLISGKEFAKLLVSQMTIAVRNLYDADTRKMICMGIIPLGCSPRVLSRWRGDSGGAAAAGKYDERGCVKEVNGIVLKYNKLMKKQIGRLNAELGGARIVFCDAYKGVMEIIRRPRRYGFEEARSACCGMGWYNASIGCVGMEMACAQPSSYVWWDLFNPTKAVNALLAESVWSNQPISGLCHPFPLQRLLL